MRAEREEKGGFIALWRGKKEFKRIRKGRNETTRSETNRIESNRERRESASDGERKEEQASNFLARLAGWVQWKPETGSGPSYCFFYLSLSPSSGYAPQVFVLWSSLERDGVYPARFWGV